MSDGVRADGGQTDADGDRVRTTLVHADVPVLVDADLLAFDRHAQQVRYVGPPSIPGASALVERLVEPESLIAPTRT